MQWKKSYELVTSLTRRLTFRKALFKYCNEPDKKTDVSKSFAQILLLCFYSINLAYKRNFSVKLNSSTAGHLIKRASFICFPRHAIRMSAGNSFLWETCGPNVFRGEYHDSFPIDLMCKDNQLGYEMARNAKVNLF